MNDRHIPKGRRRFTLLLLVTISIVASVPPVSAFILVKSVISGGEAAAEGGSFIHGGTVAEAAAIGKVSGGSFELIQGFWQPGFKVPTHVIGPPPEAIRYANGVSEAAPNPFRTGTTISFTVAETSPVRLVIYDVTGRKVRTLLDEECIPGPHRAVWDGRDAAGTFAARGVYFFQLDIGSWSATRKILRLH